MAQLPLYHSAGGKLQYPMSRRSFNFRDRHLLLIILAVFAIICLGSLYYAPEVMEQVSFDVTYRKFIGWQDENNNVLLENMENVVDDQVAPSLPEQNDQVSDIEVIKDQEENEEVETEDKHRYAELEGVEEHQVAEKVENVQEPQNDGGKLENVHPGNSDSVVTERREKVKEVDCVRACSVCML